MRRTGFLRRSINIVCLLSLSSGLCLSQLAAPPATLAMDQYEANLVAKSQAYFRQGLEAEKSDLNAALELFRKATNTYRKFKEAHYKQALTAAKLGFNEEAMNEFRTAMNLDNNYIQCRNDYALFMQHNKNDVEEAVNQWKQIIRLDPKYPYPYYFIGLVMHTKGDLDSAIEYFESYVRLKPDSPDGQLELGLCIFERASTDDIMTATKALERAAQLAPQNPMVHYHLGIIYSTKGNLDDGEAEFRTALQCDRRLAAAHWELAKLRYHRGDLNFCMAELAEAQKINPTYTNEKKYPMLRVVDLKLYKAKCLEHKGKLAEAIDAYLDVAQARGSDALYAQHIEDLKKQIKLIQKERKKKPLSYDPEEIDALVSKGQDNFEDGRLEEAKASFERALELNPNSLEATMGLCSVQEAQGDLNAAAASNQKAITIDPQFDGAFYNYGYLLEKMNLPTDAGMMYKRFHDVSGKYPYDPQHVIKLQQDLIRQQKIEENKRTRGY